MAHYPQLSTGVMAQFPLKRQVIRRTIVNRLPGGSQLKMSDLENRANVLELHYKGLTETERMALESFFRTCEGRLHTFTLLDPTRNLFRWSEDLTRPVWQPDGFLQSASGADDSEGGTRGTRLTNGAQTDQTLSQTLDGPGWFTYCFSLWLRATAPCTVALRLWNASGEIVAQRAVGTGWSLLACSGAIGGTDEEVTASLSIPAGTMVDVYGLQLEAQTSASEYRRTDDKSGVRNKCRFATDDLRFTALGIDDHAAVVRLYAHDGVSQ